MSWSYRVIRHASGMLALRVVYYNRDGSPRSHTVGPAGFVVDDEEGVEALIAMLERALRDAREEPVLDASVFSAGS
jgi:hypothetical protein